MFEQIIGHRSITSQLKRIVEEQSFSQAILISGPAAVGKYTMALEFARALHCSSTRMTDCSCASCQAMEHLSHPGVVSLGTQHRVTEIKRMLETAHTHTEDLAAAQLLIFSICKVLQRADPAFVVFTNRQHQQKIAAGFAQIKEKISEVRALLPPSTDKQIKLRKLYEEIISELEALLPIFPKNISVDTIRTVREWLRQPPTESLNISRKIFIIAQSDQLSVSSANALLKILEETPKHAMIILLARDSIRLLPTLRSRVRHFALHRRPLAEQHEVIHTFFRRTILEDTPSLSTFLKAGSPLYGKLHTLAEQLIEIVEQPQPTLHPFISEMDNVVGDKQFGQEEVRLIITAIKKCIIQRWQDHNRSHSYTQFADHTFDVLRKYQRNIQTLNFNAKEFILPMLIELKKSYAAIH